MPTRLSSSRATFAAAHAAVLWLFFGTDNVTFTASTEDPGLPAGTTRTFSSFTEAARENARSRVYLGVTSRGTATTATTPARPSASTSWPPGCVR